MHDRLLAQGEERRRRDLVRILVRQDFDAAGERTGPRGVDAEHRALGIGAVTSAACNMPDARISPS